MVEHLSKLVRLDPRIVWPSEPRNFTPWLQQNIDLLSAAIGVDIQLAEREVAVGDFSADLVGEEPGSSRVVIIENQLERTNHDHLGKLLTYAAGKAGGVIIWVAPEIRPEHRNALDWLNNATQGNIDFFGVEVELLQIEGSSLKAPNFKVVVAPKTIATTVRPPEEGQVSERNQRYQEFFQELLAQIKANRPGITNRTKVGPQSWLSLASGRGGFSFGLAFVRGARFQIELYIDAGQGNREYNKQALLRISASRAAVEDELGSTLDWQLLEIRRGSRIAWYWDKPVSILDGQAKLQELKAWAVPSYFRFRDILSPYLNNLDVEADTADVSDSSAI